MRLPVPLRSVKRGSLASSGYIERVALLPMASVSYCEQDSGRAGWVIPLWCQPLQPSGIGLVDGI